jgi:hypothetical protein
MDVEVDSSPTFLQPKSGRSALASEATNFGYMRIGEQADGKVHLVADVRGADGLPRPGSLLDLTPR